jgi:hypothetical protein
MSYPMRKPRNPVLTYGTYPALLLVTIAVIVAKIRYGWGTDPVVGALAVAAIVVTFIVERLSPLRPEWQNSDQRVGWLNYILVGTQTHRYHHSATDRGNYSSAIPLWDQVFGTFIYRPAVVPARLGLDDPGAYPDPRRFHATLAWPLRPSRPVSAPPRPGLLRPPPRHETHGVGQQAWFISWPSIALAFSQLARSPAAASQLHLLGCVSC